MSDYFAALVDRTLGLAPSVQPRVRSLHEPGNLAAREFAPPPDATPQDVVARATPALRSEDESHHDRTGAENPSPPSETKPTSAAATRDIEDELRMDAPTEIHVRRPAATPASAIAASEELLVPRAANSTPPPRSSAASEPENSSRADSPPTDSEFLRPAVAPAPRSLAPSPQDAAKPPAAPNGIAGIRRVPDPRGPIESASRQARREPRERAAPLPPEIHVTIGRIEVRAIRENRPPPARPGAAPARQSLNEYLQSRNGGARP